MNIMAEQQDDFEQTISSLLARASTDSEKIQILIDLVRQQRAELIRLKAEKEQQIINFEKEEEYISNKLLKRLEQLKAEKDALVLRVEQEEEYLTNTLQKKLTQMAKEKDEILEQQQQMRKEMETLQQSIKGYEAQRQQYEERNEKLKEALTKLKTETFLLEQKIKHEKEKNAHLIREKAMLERGAELYLERSFNYAQKTGASMRERRGRSYSLPITEMGSRSPEAISPAVSPRGDSNISPTLPPTAGRRRLSQGKAALSQLQPNVIGQAKVLKSGWLKYKQDTISQNLYFMLFENGGLTAFPSDDMIDPNNFALFTLDMDTLLSISRGDDPDTMLVLKMKKQECTLVTKSVEDTNEWEKWIVMLSPLSNTK